jgi:hypothetical protein
MGKNTERLTLYQPARYHVQVVGHLEGKRAAWFESRDLIREYDEDGTPVTTMILDVRDQAMLHGLIDRIRDLGLPLLAVDQIKTEEDEKGETQ